MTHHEALLKVEQALTDLKLKDKFGEYLTGLEALFPVYQLNKAEWDENESAFSLGLITPFQYATKSCAIIRNYSNGSFKRQVRRKLILLDVKQIEDGTDA